MVYHHVWDNFPSPLYNRPYYLSNDAVVSISKVTQQIVDDVAPEIENIYLPHSVDPEIFKTLDDKEVAKFRAEHFENETNPDRVIFFWNNRNARRKQSGSLLWWFKEFLDEVGHDNACLLMHTDPKDVHGQDLQKMLTDLDAQDGQIMISKQKVPPHLLAHLYNLADCVINISDAEGFGLSTLEALTCGTPVLVNMTGGLQEQVTDGENWFGVGIEPSSRAVIGSQEVPYIYEDRISKEDFLNALRKIYNMSKEERKALGKAGQEHVRKNYNFDTLCNRWVEVIDGLCEKHGSWETRKNYKAWEMTEIA